MPAPRTIGTRRIDPRMSRQWRTPVCLDRNSSHTGQSLDRSPSSSSRQTCVARGSPESGSASTGCRLCGHDNPMVRQTAFVLVVLVAGLAPDSALAAPALDGAALRWPWALPFVGILLTIATGPLLFPRIWHRHYGKLAFAWSALTLAPLAALLRRAGRARRVRACDARRVSELHRAVVRALRGRRRHPGDRQPARHAARQHRDPRLRHR